MTVNDHSVRERKVVIGKLYVIVVYDPKLSLCRIIQCMSSNTMNIAYFSPFNKMLITCVNIFICYKSKIALVIGNVE